LKKEEKRSSLRKGTELILNIFKKIVKPRWVMRTHFLSSSDNLRIYENYAQFNQKEKYRWINPILGRKITIKRTKEESREIL